MCASEVYARTKGRNSTEENKQNKSSRMRISNFFKEGKRVIEIRGLTAHISNQ